MNGHAETRISISRVIAPLLWAFAFLFLTEVALEYRAAGRGFRTHFFGQASRSIKDKHGTESKAVDAFGPTNEFPFRSQIIDSRKHKEKLRIWIASSSHAEDKHLSVPEVFPMILEKELKHRGIDCEVLNASRAGITLEQNENELGELGSIWEPDVVIAYQMCNDMKAGFYEGEAEYESKIVPQGLPTLTDGLDQFVEETTLYELLKVNISTRISKSKSLRVDIGPKPETLFFDRLNRLQETAELARAKFFVCTFGFSHPKSELPSDYEMFLLRVMPDLKPSSWKNVIGRWNQGIRRRYPHVTLDVADALGEQPKMFRDPVHFTRQGHQFVGRAIADELFRHFETLKLSKAFKNR